MLFGKHIKQAREQKKMSQEELAFLLNTTQKTVSNFESDKSTPTLQQLSAIEKELEIDILKLLSENGVVFNLHNSNSENAYIIKKKSTKLITKLYEQQLKDKDDQINHLKQQLAFIQEQLANIRP